MIGLTLTCVALAAILFGTVAHFWILARLESAGVRVKYLANLGDNFRAYKTYRVLARDRRLPMWPFYGVFAVYVGVILAALGFFFDSPLPKIARWLK